MTRTAADPETVPVAVADLEALRRWYGAEPCNWGDFDDARRRLVAAIPESEDPDAELVEAMTRVWARREGAWTYRMQGVLDLLRDRGECFHPGHGQHRGLEF